MSYFLDGQRGNQPLRSLVFVDILFIELSSVDFCILPELYDHPV
jgi:hypothetical protein